MKNNEITIRGEKNGLLPVLDAFGFYWQQRIGRNSESRTATSLGGTSTGTTVNTVPGGYWRCSAEPADREQS